MWFLVHHRKEELIYGFNVDHRTWQREGSKTEIIQNGHCNEWISLRRASIRWKFTCKCRQRYWSLNAYLTTDSRNLRKYGSKNEVTEARNYSGRVQLQIGLKPAQAIALEWCLFSKIWARSLTSQCLFVKEIKVKEELGYPGCGSILGSPGRGTVGISLQ